MLIAFFAAQGSINPPLLWYILDVRTVRTVLLLVKYLLSTNQSGLIISITNFTVRVRVLYCRLGWRKTRYIIC
jgi:hypothetical protein